MTARINIYEHRSDKLCFRVKCACQLLVHAVILWLDINLMSLENLRHVQGRDMVIGLIESHGENLIIIYFPNHLNIWRRLLGKIFFVIEI